MEQSYSFVWPADGKPYFIRPDHQVIELNVDGRVPVIDSSCRVLNSKQFKKDCDLSDKQDCFCASNQQFWYVLVVDPSKTQ